MKETVTAPKKHRGSGRVPFLANLEAIKNEVDQGWPLSATYEKFKEKLDISYIQFTRYVRKYIQASTITRKKQGTETPAESANTEILELSVTRGPVPEMSLESKLERLNNPMPLEDSE